MANLQLDLVVAVAQRPIGAVTVAQDSMAAVVVVHLVTLLIRLVVTVVRVLSSCSLTDRQMSSNCILGIWKLIVP
jgi:hypothetical protein